MNYRTYSDAEVLKWYEIYADNTKSAKHLSKTLGVKHDTILRRFRKLGLALRPSGFRVNNVYGRPGFDNIRLGYLWFYKFAYKRRAIRKKLDFSLTEDEFIAIVTSNCKYCGKSHLEETRVVAKKRLPMLTVDRTDSSKGYVKGNCVPCCKECNTSKMDSNLEAWLDKMLCILKHLGRV